LQPKTNNNMKNIVAIACVVALAACGSSEQEAVTVQGDSAVVAPTVIDSPVVVEPVVEDTVTAVADTAQ